jgi:hypothetical protein
MKKGNRTALFGALRGGPIIVNGVQASIGAPGVGRLD